MVSIVLPTYNGEKVIEEAIKSILKQSYERIELVIVNDCSTDSTKQIIEKYACMDSRIKIINNVENRKLPASLNIGFDNCKGNYFTWTSDDNILKPNMIERLLKILKDTGADFVYAKSEYIDNNGQSLSISDDELLKNINNLYFTNIIGACFLYKSVLHQELHGYDEQKFLVEDYDFWLRAKGRHKFVYLPEVLYQYRVHGESLSGQRKLTIKKMTIELWERELVENRVPPNILVKVYFNIVYFCFEINDINKMRYYMKLLKRYSMTDYKRLGVKMRLCKYFNKDLVVRIKKNTLKKWRQHD